MRIYGDATTLIALGSVGELSLLEAFDGACVVLPAIRDEVTTEPAVTNLKRWCTDRSIAESSPGSEADRAQARKILDSSQDTGDVHLVAAVLAHTAADEPVGVVSDDRRVRTVSRGLGSRVTGTIGVIVRAVRAGLDPDEARSTVRRVDDHGLHLTGELRETADDLIAETAEACSE